MRAVRTFGWVALLAIACSQVVACGDDDDDNGGTAGTDAGHQDGGTGGGSLGSGGAAAGTGGLGTAGADAGVGGAAGTDAGGADAGAAGAAGSGGKDGGAAGADSGAGGADAGAAGAAGSGGKDGGAAGADSGAAGAGGAAGADSGAGDGAADADSGAGGGAADADSGVGGGVDGGSGDAGGADGGLLDASPDVTADAAADVEAGPPPVCGDTVCASAETCDSCPQDCGDCTVNLIAAAMGQACADGVKKGCLDNSLTGSDQTTAETCANAATTVITTGAWAGKTRRQACLDTMSCMLGSKASASDGLACFAEAAGALACFCGTAQGATCLASPNGVCLAAEEAGLESTSPSDIAGGGLFGDTTGGSGAAFANSIASCMGDSTNSDTAPCRQ